MMTIKKLNFFSLIFLVILCRNLYPQSSDIEQTYQRSDKKYWGELYNWALGRSEFNKSYALVIGIGDYQKDWPDLEASSRDAERIRDFLIQDEGFDYVITLTNSKATKQKINKLMEETFPKILGEKDRFFFYLSGHGTQRIKGEIISGYLVLSNCGKEDYAEMISMDDISRWDRWLYQTRHVLFMLDCCFSGLAGQQHKAALIDKKLERLSQYAHHLITAGTANESSVASLANWQGSLFTDAFLKAVSGRGDLNSADYGADGVVCLKEFMKYVDDRIDDESVKLKNRNPLAKGVKMSPQISDLQENEGEFFFITKRHKNQKLQNNSDAPLNYGWPVERKGPVETFTPPKIEPEPQKTVVSHDSEIIKPILRDKAVTLTADQVEAMLKGNKFFDNVKNGTAPGWQNQFVPKILNGQKVVHDRSTGLVWQQSGSPQSTVYSRAFEYVNELNHQRFAGFNDWHLPTLEEAMSLMEPNKLDSDLYIEKVFDKTQTSIWTCDLDAEGSASPWVVFYENGGCGRVYLGFCYVRAVRIDQSSQGTVTHIFRDKSKILSKNDVNALLQKFDFYCYKYGWNNDYCNPDGRGFTNDYKEQKLSGQKVVIDRASGLMWQQGGSPERLYLMDVQKWSDDQNRKGYAGFHDWRLPTLEEAMSLMEPKKLNGDLYIDPVFDNTQRWIWTTDQVAGGSAAVWVVGFCHGLCDPDSLYNDGYVRAVRSGLSSTGE